MEVREKERNWKFKFNSEFTKYIELSLKSFSRRGWFWVQFQMFLSALNNTKLNQKGKLWAVLFKVLLSFVFKTGCWKWFFRPFLRIKFPRQIDHRATSWPSPDSIPASCCTATSSGVVPRWPRDGSPAPGASCRRWMDSTWTGRQCTNKAAWRWWIYRESGVTRQTVTRQTVKLQSGMKALKRGAQVENVRRNHSWIQAWGCTTLSPEQWRRAFQTGTAIFQFLRKKKPFIDKISQRRCKNLHVKIIVFWKKIFYFYPRKRFHFEKKDYQFSSFQKWKPTWTSFKVFFFGLIEWSIDWIDWLIERLMKHWSNGRLMDWLIDWLNNDWTIDRMNDWLIDWNGDFFNFPCKWSCKTEASSLYLGFNETKFCQVFYLKNFQNQKEKTFVEDFIVDYFFNEFIKRVCFCCRSSVPGGAMRTWSWWCSRRRGTLFASSSAIASPTSTSSTSSWMIFSPIRSSVEAIRSWRCGFRRTRKCPASWRPWRWPRTLSAGIRSSSGWIYASAPAASCRITAPWATCTSAGSDSPGSAWCRCWVGFAFWGDEFCVLTCQRVRWQTAKWPANLLSETS